MKILVLVVFSFVVACAPVPAKLSYEQCMKYVQDGTLMFPSDREFCETLNK